MDNAKEYQICCLIAYLKDQIQLLEPDLPETYGFLMSELDQQMRQLVEMQVQQMKTEGSVEGGIQGS